MLGHDFYNKRFKENLFGLYNQNSYLIEPWIQAEHSGASSRGVFNPYITYYLGGLQTLSSKSLKQLLTIAKLPWIFLRNRSRQTDRQKEILLTFSYSYRLHLQEAPRRPWVWGRQGLSQPPHYFKVLKRKSFSTIVGRKIQKVYRFLYFFSWDDFSHTQTHILLILILK